VSALLKKHKLTPQKVGKWLANEMMGVNARERQKRRKQKEKQRMKRRAEINTKKKVFGKVRYYFALWFGQWILFSWQKRRIN
jgi:hypothetical protein